MRRFYARVEHKVVVGVDFVQYASKTLDNAVRNYATTEKEFFVGECRRI